MPIVYNGTTALVTGASSGLGAEFARQLAGRGADLVLVARRTDRLEALAVELRRAHGVQVTVVSQDLAEPGAAARLAEDLTVRGIAVHSLVNNAGFATRSRFENESADRIHEEVAVNVAALVDITRVFYPGLLAHGRGVLITIASTGAYQPVPLMAVYGATKAFVLSFTEALWYEAKGTGLSVLAVSPGATRTEFFDVAGENARIGALQTPAEVVRLALATLDRKNPPPSVISGVANRLTAGSTRLLPRRALASLTGRITGRLPLEQR